MLRKSLLLISMLAGVMAPEALGQPPNAPLSYLKLPLSFEANRGQADPRVEFLSRGAGYALFLTRDEAVLKLANEPQPIHLKLVGASSQLPMEGTQPLPGRSNYFLGNDPSHWVTDVPQYGEVRYRGVYRGIDLVYHGDHQSGGRLEYDFVVAPGADPDQILMDFSSSNTNSGIINQDAGDLLLQIGNSQLRNVRPRVYQIVNGVEREIPGRYMVSGRRRVRFALGSYDHSRALVIDPVIMYATTLGNTAITEPCQPCLATAVDASGNVYVAGSTTDTNFPTQNPEQANPGGQKDVFVSKINAAGTALVFSNYLGGGGSDVAYGLALDSSNNVYITGYTNSGGSNNTTSFPTHAPIQAALNGFVNAFVTKLNSTGSALVYSTYLGGSLIDVSNGIAVDSTGAAYIAGYTYSSDFPTASPFQSVNRNTNNSTNAFLTKINAAGTALVYSTYLGGTVADAAYAVTVDSSFRATVVGGTSSQNFPTASPLQAANANTGGGDNAFIAEMNAAGSGLVFSTYYGGSGTSDAYSVALDSSNNVYVAGFTNSVTTFPTFNPMTPPSGGSGGFLVKLNAGGASAAYATTIDSNGKGVAVDSYGNAYLTGRGVDTGANAVSVALRVNAAGNGLDYDFKLGESLTDVAQALALDSSGNVYIAGTGNINTTTNPPQSSNNSAATVSIAKIGATPGAPYIGMLSPSVAVAGTSSVNLRVIGTGFQSGAQVLVGGSARSSNLVSATEVDGTLTASDLASPATLTITVQNTSGGPSNTAAFTVTATPPTITGFSPASSTAGTGAFTLTVNGTGFTNGAVVYWNSSARTTNFVSATQVTAQILAGDIASGGVEAVQVFAPSPGGGLSSAASYTVNNPAPLLTSISPNTQVAGSSAFTLTATGTGFTGSSVVQWGGSPRSTSFVSTTQLTAAILATDLMNSGPVTVTVQTPTPGGGTSTGQTFTVSGNSVPQLTSLSPSSAIAGGSGFTLTVNGTGFVSASQVLWNDVARSTNFINSGQLTTAISSSDVSSISTANVTVSSPSPGGGTSNTLTFSINGNPPPTTSSVSPNAATAGSAGFTLTVTGTGFVSSSTIFWNGASRTSNVASSTSISTQITASDIASGGTASVQVFVPSPGGGLSSPALTFTINNPVPAITTISPNTLPQGGGNFTLTANGSGFTPSSVVQWNGAPRTTTFSSSSQLTAAIQSSDLNTSGTQTVTVFNPSPAGGTSGGAGFTVASNPTPAIGNLSPSVVGAGSGDFTITVTGTGFINSSTVTWNSGNRTTTFVNATTLTAQILAADVSGVGTATVQVSNPAPGGGLSNSQVFTISSGCTYLLSPSQTSFPPSASTGTVAVNAPSGCAWSASLDSSGASFITVTGGASGSGSGTVNFSVAQNSGAGKSGTLTVAGQQITITQAAAIEGTVAPTAAKGSVNVMAHVPVTVSLNNGVSVDGISFTLQVTPNSSAPAPTSNLSFSADGALPAPGSVSTSGGVGTITVTWTGLSPASTGSVNVGDVLVALPAGAQAGQTYTAQITAASGTFQSNAVPLAAGASAAVTVALDYLVGDPFPSTGDSVGNFGDGAINTLDLITTLRVATNIQGFVPPTCSDRFDSKDASPADTATTRGGNGVINTLDLIVILQKATNLDITRPHRLSRNLCGAEAQSAPAPHRAEISRELPAEAALEIEAGNIYLRAAKALHLAGLAISLGSTDNGAILSWTAAELAPNVVDSSLASTIAAAWLTNLDIPAGGRLLLGRVTSSSAAPVAVVGVSANDRASGKDIAIEISRR